MDPKLFIYVYTFIIVGETSPDPVLSNAFFFLYINKLLPFVLMFFSYSLKSEKSIKLSAGFVYIFCYVKYKVLQSWGLYSA